MTGPSEKDRGLEPVPRIALRPNEAAASLGIGRDTFDRLVAPDLRCIRMGRLKLYPVEELSRWAARSAARTLERDR